MHHLGIEGSYEARRAGVAELEHAIEELRSGTLDGMNITMPLKGDANRAAESLTAEARTSKSVNTLRVRDGSLEGHSTDVVASVVALADQRFMPEVPVLILGAGGAAAAVLAAAAGRTTYVAGRDPRRAAAVAGLATPAAAVVPFGTAVVGALLVNATPLGMKGESLPGNVIDVASGVVDLAYGDDATPLVRWAEATGLPVMDGVEFLALQAAAAFEWWTGISAPREVMFEAARKR
jgi:shikimate dehydrogenase